MSIPKFAQRLAATACTLAAFAALCSAAPNDPVIFSDPELALAILVQYSFEQLPDPPDSISQITEAHMERLTKIVPEEYTADLFNASDFGGIEYAINLERIDVLIGQPEINLSKLASLPKLKELGLSSSKLANVEIISQLSSLETLRLTSCELFSAPDISTLINLRTLNLGGNAITNLDGLRNHSELTSLVLAWNSNLPDLSPIASLTELKSLRLSGTSTTDLTALAGLTKLEELHLDYNLITNLSPLSGMTELRDLRLDRNPQLANLSTLAGLTAMTSLSADDCKILDISPLATASSLQTLSLDKNQISDLTPISQHTTITEFRCDENLLDTLPDMSGMTSLQRVFLRGNFLDSNPNSPGRLAITALSARGVAVSYNRQIDPYSFVIDTNLETIIRATLNKPTGWISPADMASLTTLSALQAGIETLDGIEHAVNLQVLNISENSISDLSPLADLSSLTHLKITSNRIIDLSIIADLTGLIELEVASNGIVDITPLEDMTQLDFVDLDGNGLDTTPGSQTANIIAQLEAGGTSIDVSGQTWPVTVFTDPQLRAAVVASLDIEHQLLITPTDLLPLRRLVAPRSTINNLEGLGDATNLVALQISDNLVNNITLLANLQKLEFLDLSGNHHINDLSVIASLTHLHYLDLSGLPTDNLTSLENLAELEQLVLDEVTDPDAVAVVSALETSGATVYESIVISRPESGELALSRVAYRPTRPNQAEVDAGFEQRSDFEYVLIKNLTARTLELGRLEFDSGIDFDFVDGIYQSIPPKFEIAIAGNLAGFELRYGPESCHRVTGEFDGKLADSGEELLIDRPGAGIIRRVSYNNPGEPWPEEANELGLPLILLSQDPDRTEDSLPQFWRVPTQDLHPFTSDVYTYRRWQRDHFDAADLDNDSIVGPAADPDGDGTENVAEYAYGSDPWNPQEGEGAYVQPGQHREDAPAGQRTAYLQLSYYRSANADEALISAETSPDLLNWTTNHFLIELVINPLPSTDLYNPDGSLSRLWRFHATRPITPDRDEYLRLSIKLIEH